MGTILKIIWDLFRWVFKPTDFISKKDFNKLLTIELLGLSIEDHALLLTKRKAKKYRYLYFPVVPTDVPNLIHVTFIRYLIPLKKIGLKPIVFVFDEYAKQIKPEYSKEKAEMFIENMNRIGMNKANPKVIYQSEITKVSSKIDKLFPLIMNCLGTMIVEDLINATGQKSYFTGKTKVIRLMKPILNMTYLFSLKKRIGFILSGIDEKLVWTRFDKLFSGSQDYINPVKLYIPRMVGLSGEGTHVLDSENNIIVTDDLEKIIQKVKESLLKSNGIINEQSSIFYILKYLYFPLGNYLEISQSDSSNPKVKCTSLSELNVMIGKKEYNQESLIHSICVAILHALKGELFLD